MILFGFYLRQLRKEHNVSLQTLAQKLDVSVPFLSLIENNKKTVPINYGDKLTEIFNLNPEQSKELKNSIDYTNKKISIDLQDMNDAQQEVTLAFARTINTASQKKLEELRKILESDDEEWAVINAHQ